MAATARLISGAVLALMSLSHPAAPAAAQSGNQIDVTLVWRPAATGPDQIRYRDTQGPVIEAIPDTIDSWSKALRLNAGAGGNVRSTQVGLLYSNNQSVLLPLRFPVGTTGMRFDITSELRACNKQNIDALELRKNLLVDPDDVPALVLTIDRMLRATCPTSAAGPRARLAEILSDAICIYSNNPGVLDTSGFAAVAGSVQQGLSQRVAECEAKARLAFIDQSKGFVAQALRALTESYSDERLEAAIEAFGQLAAISDDPELGEVFAQTVDLAAYREPIVGVVASQMQARALALQTDINSLPSQAYESQLPAIKMQMGQLQQYASLPAGNILKDAYERGSMGAYMTGMEAQVQEKEITAQWLSDNPGAVLQLRTVEDAAIGTATNSSGM